MTFFYNTADIGFRTQCSCVRLVFEMIYCDASSFVSRHLCKLQCRLMEALPNELLAHILAFLHPNYDNLARLSLVYKRWKDVIEETPSLWKCIDFARAYLLCITENARHRDVLRHCLFKFGRYGTCLRGRPITRTFTDPSLRNLLFRLTSLNYLDAPLLEWDPRFLQNLQCACALRRDESDRIPSFRTREIQWLFQQPDTLQKKFITPQHLQMVLLRFPHRRLKHSIS